MKRRGISLVELVVSVMIMAILVLVVVNIFIGVSAFSRAEQGKILAGDNVTRTFATLDQTLLQAKSILSSATVNSTGYTSSSTTVILTIPSIVSGSASATVSDTAVITWDSSSGLLYLITAADASSSRTSGTTILTTGVSDVYFRYPTDDPSGSTAVTAVVITASTVNGKTTNQQAVLYVPIRNHP